MAFITVKHRRQVQAPYAAVDRDAWEAGPYRQEYASGQSHGDDEKAVRFGRNFVCGQLSKVILT